MIAPAITSPCGKRKNFITICQSKPLSYRKFNSPILFLTFLGRYHKFYRALAFVVDRLSHNYTVEMIKIIMQAHHSS